MTTRDVRHVLRLFSRDTTFCLTVVLIMALGIGFCTAIFSLVKAVWLARLPYKDAERLAIVWHTNADSAEVTGVWARDYQTYRDTTRSFQSVAAFTTEGYNLSHGSEPSRIACSRVTSNLFPMLGVMPVRGRWLVRDDDRNGAPRTIVLSYDFWRSRLGSADEVLGKTLRLDMKPYTVVGVMPPSFVFPPEGIRHVSKSECWVPASFSAMEMSMPAFNWVVLGDLKPGVGIGQAQQDAAAIAAGILESYPAAVQKEVALRARVVTMQDEVVGRTRTPLLIFAGSVGFLLLIGCANVANLMLTKLHIRQREIAIRAAFGATRSSLTGQLLSESVALALCGGFLGLPVALGMLRLLTILTPGRLEMLEGIRIDMTVLVFATVCSVLCGLLAGLVPAVRAKTIDVASAIARAEGERGSSGGPAHSRFRSALAVSEIAMALVLLIGAGLLLRSYIQLANVPPGFDPDNLVTFSVVLPEERYKEAPEVRRFVSAVLAGLRSVKDVTSAAAGTDLPVGSGEATVFSRIGAPAAVAGFKPALIHTITPEYLQTFGTASKRGRTFEFSDNASRTPVALVNEAMARTFWPDADVMGKQLYWLAGGRNLTVIGVVADVRQGGPASAATPAFYVPIEQSPQPVRNLVFAIRTGRPAGALGVEVRRVVREIDPALPVFSIQSGHELVWNSVADERFNMFIVTAFAICALVLSLSGLYAVVSYMVSHSSRELGIRMALGASPRRILGRVIVRGLSFLLSGILIGTVMALMLTRFMKGMLFGITDTDPLTFSCVIALLVSVAVMAIFVPAILAARLDTAHTLR